MCKGTASQMHTETSCYSIYSSNITTQKNSVLLDKNDMLYAFFIRNLIMDYLDLFLKAFVDY